MSLKFYTMLKLSKSFLNTSTVCHKLSKGKYKNHKFTYIFFYQLYSMSFCFSCLRNYSILTEYKYVFIFIP